MGDFFDEPAADKTPSPTQPNAAFGDDWGQSAAPAEQAPTTATGFNATGSQQSLDMMTGGSPDAAAGRASNGTPSVAAADSLASTSRKVPTVEEGVREAEKSIVAQGKAKADAEQQSITQRINEADKSASAGAQKMKTEASTYRTELTDARAKSIATAKKVHREEQQGREERRAKLQRGGTLWEQVAEQVDIAKPNKFASKSTDRMRSLLGQLRTKPNAPQVSAAVA